MGVKIIVLLRVIFIHTVSQAQNYRTKYSIMGNALVHRAKASIIVN